MSACPVIERLLGFVANERTFALRSRRLRAQARTFDTVNGPAAVLLHLPAARERASEFAKAIRAINAAPVTWVPNAATCGPPPYVWRAPQVVLLAQITSCRSDDAVTPQLHGSLVLRLLSR